MHDAVPRTLTFPVGIRTLILALLAGALIGTLFFGGLWWTVQKGVASKRPALWFFGSMLLRMSVALTGFYVISVGHWERLLVSVLGFVIARGIVTRYTRGLPQGRTQATEQPPRWAPETSHAP